ncbi:hypothetical protein EZH22_24500 [Xanthobacter dioxanivorans]|uniref:Uncharacterized protein n=1 Tax=Xanthobacter dioxanivorans TaxID=2528964 RepID=A0A974SIE7_9HYPH|nr:hypothetical protein [Xanthobacter dioxanivorans]QRG06114.1 hypothetical protein EZH22_24500 [Xanthobacter dioxanivorans]
MSADIISLHEHRASRDDARGILIAEARRRYAEAKQAAEASLDMRDGIHAARCFVALADALHAAERDVTDIDALFPAMVSAWEMAAEALARCRTRGRESEK